MPLPPETHDVTIVGAGLAGIGTAYWLQKKCPQKSFTILEARDNMGGTWDLFRYPGIRSDSDMFTFGYRFQPWQEPKSLSSGAQILDYLRDTAGQHGIDDKIRYGHRVTAADWKGDKAEWTLTIDREGEEIQLRTRFLYLCTGYYSYEEAHRPQFPGEESFAGRIVHPQFWPDDLDYTDQRVVVVGSGATAVTLVPALAERAAHVTMLQRSPTHIMTLPNRSALYVGLKKVLPQRWAYRLTRWVNLGGGMLLYGLSRAFPKRIADFIRKGVARQVGPEIDVDQHFRPSYDPWDQRLCLVPDGDLFRALREKQARVLTDAIDRFTNRGLLLASGKEVPADLVVLATGLKVNLLGGAAISLNGRRVRSADIMLYKGMLPSGLPNVAIAFGYTNASWTLKTDLTANYVCKLLNYLDRKGYATVVPKRETDVAEEPFLDFSAGYIKRAADVMPKQGSRRPWRVYQNYAMDALITRFGRIDDGVLELGRRSAGTTPANEPDAGPV
ncbi:cyclohexanone monooxygenase [Neolewinella xylanilytica]|uniref:Cyclohexanone monooxygenase n=1 Tax=Neolewinella xylanilytica TaxID=1514080 RepID=A0A2S6I973_9BACT|nr:NAD(P)/FAD-dependent oxidoreductase [Neolewinella xylanilytica]PPK88050.1 cyclohexanone monooxygenase [Neolewinella xylanilytica]